MSRWAWIIDIDGTQADLTHRLHHFPHNHAAFEAGIPDDSPIWPVITIARALKAADYAILVTTGRAEKTRAATTKWLDDHGSPHDQIYMRADGDHRADHIVKQQILSGIRDDGYEIIGVIDDRQSVVDMWREEGLLCLQNAPDPSASDYQTTEGIRPQLTLMVGPSGAGKTSWLDSERARQEYGIHPQHVLSSDQVRLDLYGTMQCMDQNKHVFEALHSVVRSRLKVGLPAVVDATNIRDKARRAIVDLGQGVCPVRYIVIDRPLDQKLATGGWRLDIKFTDGTDLITRHDQVFRSNIKAIMRGDGNPDITVHDERVIDPARQAAA